MSPPVFKAWVPKARPPVEPHERRAMPPGGGLVVAGFISVMFWAVIVGIVALR